MGPEKKYRPSICTLPSSSIIPPTNPADNMSLRTIRPSLKDDSTSSSNPTYSDPTSSDPRPKHPAENPPGVGAPLLSKRRRVPDSITRNACLNCKKARAKCDGKTPCTRCSSRAEAAPCVYEVHIKHAKEELMKQIHDFRAKDRLTDRILRALQSDDHTQDILSALRSGDSNESIVERLGRAPADDQDGFSPVDSQHSTELLDHEYGAAQLPRLPWTSVTRDPDVLDHLFQLYFAWVHPVSTLFSERHFYDSYKRQAQRHCSPLLVNAMCALACHFHTHSDDCDADYDQLGASFADAFRAAFDPEDKAITSIQATAVMFLVDLARGSGLRASSYLRLASEHIAEVSASAADEVPLVLKSTLQGIRCLNIQWAQVTFQCPMFLGPRPVEDTPDDTSLDESPWYFYRYEEDKCPAWPALLATTNRERVKLNSIISDVGTMMYGSPPTAITAHHILEQYGRFLAWRAALPAALSNIGSKSQALPHVLSLLILYHYSVVQLLRPLLDHDGFPPELVDEVIWTHAQRALFFLSHHYHPHYTCRYQPVLQMFAVAHLCALVARFFPTKPTADPATKDAPEALALGLEVLHESLLGFPAAATLQELLRRAADAQGVRLPPSHEHLLAPARAPRALYAHDEFVDVCARPGAQPPLWCVRERFASDLAEEWARRGAEYGFRTSGLGRRAGDGAYEVERGGPYLMNIRNLLNTN